MQTRNCHLAIREAVPVPIAFRLLTQFAIFREKTGVPPNRWRPVACTGVSFSLSIRAYVCHYPHILCYVLLLCFVLSPDIVLYICCLIVSLSQRLEGIVAQWSCCFQLCFEALPVKKEKGRVVARPACSPQLTGNPGTVLKGLLPHLQ